MLISKDTKFNICNCIIVVEKLEQCLHKMESYEIIQNTSRASICELLDDNEDLH